jgi:hypothetical protein
MEDDKILEIAKRCGLAIDARILEQSVHVRFARMIAAEIVGNCECTTSKMPESKITN